MKNLYDSVLDTSLFKKFVLTDMLFTEYKCLEEDSFFKVWSHVNYFVYVLNGKKGWHTMHNKYMVYTGEAIFVKKGANIIHKFFEEDFCAMIIFVPDHFIQEVMQEKTITNKSGATSADSVIPVESNRSIKAYFDSLFAYFLQPEAPSKDLLEIKFKELILTLLNSEDNPSICYHFKTLSNPTIHSFQKIMEDNFTYNLSLNEFARLCGKSLSSFKRDFKSLYHTSPGKWLIRKRLQYAKWMLETTDQNINEIVFQSGFENASHFITKFKNEYGMTPNQFKKSHIT